MSKSRRASSPGSIGSGHRLYRPRRGTKRTRDLQGRPRPLLWGAIYVWLPKPSTGFFATLLQAAGPRFGGHDPALMLNRISGRRFKASRNLILPDFYKHAQAL